MLHLNVLPLPPIEQSTVSGAPCHLLWKPQTPVQSLRPGAICIFWKAFFVFAILQSVDALDQKNVYYELKQRDRYASTTITYYIIEKLFGI